VTQVTAAATSVLTLVFKESLAIVGLLAYLLWLNWPLTLLALTMLPLIVLVVRRRERPAACFQPRGAAGDGIHHAGD
jgi:ABC-type multidrug transport system fused ATPase/permease subunit